MYCALRHILPGFFVLVLLTLGAAASVFADRTDFRVNEDNGTADQDHPRVAVAADGTFVISWVDRRNSSADIFLQRYLADGTKIGSNVLVNDDGLDAYQSEPAIAADYSGQYSLVWKDYRTGSYPFDPNVFFQRFDTALAPTGLNRVLTTGQPQVLKETPDIALSPWGGGIVVWADYRSGQWDIYGQLINSAGDTFGTNFKVNDNVGIAQQHGPRVAVSSEGWFVVAWYDNREGNDDIFVQRFDSLAAPVGANVRANSDSTNIRQAFPDVATDGAGHFTVVWVDWRNGVYPSNPDIYTRKFDTSMTPLAVEALVNEDESKRAQREPTIAADRRGNVAIIWSDSSGTAQSYDVRGQMVDVDGVIREVNFQANSEADSAQLHADVALDGRYRYVTWADKRNGNYDIYASITKYNDPTLDPTPTALSFEMLEGGSLPAAQELHIEHNGYNPINFELRTSHDWLQVTPWSGSTPASIDVSINTDSLPFGIYSGAIMLVDTDAADSSVLVAVRLNVTTPILSVTPDSLSFLIFAGIPDSASQSLTIVNDGAGDLNWSITESIDWLNLSQVSGANNAILPVWAVGTTMAAGTYIDSFQVSAPGAQQSPQNVVVTVEAVDDLPYISLSEDTIWIATENPAGETRYLHITNPGAGTLDWTATVGHPWLMPSITSGSDNDTIILSIDTLAMKSGLLTSYVDITDSAAFHPVERMVFVLDYMVDSQDTILVNSVQTSTSSSDSLLIELTLLESGTQIDLPLIYDTALVTLDSVRSGDNWPEGFSLGLQTDPTRNMAVITASATEPDGFVPPGSYNLGWLYFTTGETTGRCLLREPDLGERAMTITSLYGGRRHPVSFPGEIMVDGATGITEGESELLPDRIRLHQNYPNPFNPSTIIEFALPERSAATLEIFNILGQRVRLLVEESLSAGVHKMLWNGEFATGQTAPSGIYFYRLQVADQSLVRKMVLVK